MAERARILAVDDEAFNLDIMSEYLTGAGYAVTQAADGEQAWQCLNDEGPFDVIVLDRMMPRMNGMQFLQKQRGDSRFGSVPVVMQTAAASSKEVAEGVRAGVYYYLTKPYERDLLLTIVRSALNDNLARKTLQQELRNTQRVPGLMEYARFRFRTLEEGRTVAQFVANCYADPERVIFGLNEMIVNAIEHGNLGISYEEKSRLLMSNTWEQEVNRRLELPEHAEKLVTLTYEAAPDAIMVHIGDEGKGFDWKPYLDFSSDRATAPNGRGIMISRMLSFDDVQYLGCGNEVVCRMNLK